MALLALCAAVATGVWLWQWIDLADLAASVVKDKVAAQLDVLKIAASVAVGVGGLFALYLAARRQRTQEQELETRRAELGIRRAELSQRDRAQEHAEQVAEDTRTHADRTATAVEFDAAARREADQFTRAIDHLGSDAAPVRLVGLLNLERFAQEHESHRRTVLGIVCSYLRMPFEPSNPTLLNAQSSEEVRARQMLADYRAGMQEREVRLAAQKLLNAHLGPYIGFGNDRSPNPAYWGDDNTELDLTGATLMNFSLLGCEVGKAHFEDAHFYGKTNFFMMTVNGEANFNSAHFHGESDLKLGKPLVDVDLLMSGKRAEVSFMGTKFLETVEFRQTLFSCDARFHSVSFGHDLGLAEAKFERDAGFLGSTFKIVLDVETASFARGVPDQLSRYLHH